MPERRPAAPTSDGVPFRHLDVSPVAAVAVVVVVAAVIASFLLGADDPVEYALAGAALAPLVVATIDAVRRLG